jgi:hypothetical protein
MGWPGSERLPGRAATVRTYGSALANGSALDVVLSGGGQPDAQ